MLAMTRAVRELKSQFPLGSHFDVRIEAIKFQHC